MLAAGTASPALAQTVNIQPLFTLDGSTQFGLFGVSVAGAGDVNGDGFDDVIVGEPGDDPNGFYSGSATVFSGADGSELFAVEGQNAYDGLGYAVAGAGDVNGDGFDDVIAGSPYDSATGAYSGTVRVFSGVDGSELFAFSSGGTDDGFGYAVAGAGDANGDGFDDVVVGAPYASPNGAYSGSATVFSGSDGSVLFTVEGQSADDGAGFAVAGAGDVNGDGFDDLIVGSPYASPNGVYSGSVRVLSGVDGSELFKFDGNSADDSLGRSVAGAGDVNGDGMDDIIVGAPYASPNGSYSGTAVVFSGADGSTLSTFDGSNAFDISGYDVSGAGDVNGDGLDDLVVSAPFSDSTDLDTGSVAVYSGADGSLIRTIAGPSSGFLFGLSVSGAGDVDGNGLGDIVIGSPFAGANNIGQAIVYASELPANTLDFNGDGSTDISDLIGFINEFFGAQADPALDFNGDGSIDISDLVNYINDFFASP